MAGVYRQTEERAGALPSRVAGAAARLGVGGGLVRDAGDTGLERERLAGEHSGQPGEKLIGSPGPVRTAMELPLDRADVYEYLADAALGFQPLSGALGGDATTVMLPILITASMLFTFCPGEQGWGTYLDQIWGAYETSQNVELSVLPALQVRTQMHKALSGR
jgi:hypothetical protein